MGNAERSELQLEASCSGCSDAFSYQDANRHRRQSLHSCWKCLKLLLKTAVEGRVSLPSSKEGGVQGRERFGCRENYHQTPLWRGKKQQFWKYRPLLRRHLKDRLLWRTD